MEQEVGGSNPPNCTNHSIPSNQLSPRHACVWFSIEPNRAVQQTGIFTATDGVSESQEAPPSWSFVCDTSVLATAFPFIPSGHLNNCSEIFHELSGSSARQTAMQTIRQFDTIDNGATSTRVIVAHAELNAQFVFDVLCEFACRPTLQEAVTAPVCFSSRSADDDDHRVRTTGADSLLPEPKELPCRFVKQSSPRSLQPSSWRPASPQAALAAAITAAVIMAAVITITAITITVTTIMVITIMAIIITAGIIMATTITIATTVSTSTNEEKPADGVGRLTTWA